MPFVENPLTGRMIEVGGRLYNKLKKEGVKFGRSVSSKSQSPKKAKPVSPKSRRGKEQKTRIRTPPPPGYSRSYYIKERGIQKGYVVFPKRIRTPPPPGYGRSYYIKERGIQKGYVVFPNKNPHHKTDSHHVSFVMKPEKVKPTSPRRGRRRPLSSSIKSIKRQIFVERLKELTKDGWKYVGHTRDGSLRFVGPGSGYPEYTHVKVPPYTPHNILKFLRRLA
jgi:hypothetical protein